MLSSPAFTTFHDAYLAVLRHVSDEPQYRNAPRGNAARECLNLSFTLTDPRQRIVYAPARRTNIVFCFAEALWYLSGRDDLQMISYYAPRLIGFSADGHKLTGSAYGPKLFRPTHTGASQWERVLNLLAEDPASKRAVISFFAPEELTDPGNPDVSCTLGLQFLLRDGRLHAVTYMRGNDAVIGLVCDVFSFTLIQEFTAHQLGVPLGSYSHHVGSMHVNDVDGDQAATITAAGQPQPSFPATAMPPTRWSDLAIVTRWEQALRHDAEHLGPSDLDRLGIDPYWQQVVLLFEVYRQITHQPNSSIEPATLHALHPAYRWLVANRWPERIGEDFAISAGERQ